MVTLPINLLKSGDILSLKISRRILMFFLIMCLALPSVKAQVVMGGMEASAPDLFMHFEYNQELGKQVITVFRHQGIINKFDFTGLGYALSPWAANKTHAAFSFRLGLYDLQFLGFQPLIYVQHSIGESRWLVKGEFSWRQGYPAMAVKLGCRLW